MSNKNLVITLNKRLDKDGMPFYVGKLKAPVLIDLSSGATFLVFVCDNGSEELQIALMDSKDDRND